MWQGSHRDMGLLTAQTTLLYSQEHLLSFSGLGLMWLMFDYYIIYKRPFIFVYCVQLFLNGQKSGSRGPNWGPSWIKKVKFPNGQPLGHNPPTRKYNI